MKKISILLIIVLLAATILIFLWRIRWIILHGNSASLYANQLITNPTQSVPTEFIDYTVYNDHGCVEFFNNDSNSKIFVYKTKLCEFSKVQPSINKIHFFSNWYMIDVKN